MSSEVTAPMPGKISKILVKVGEKIGEDDEMMILEAMKMDNPIYATADGAITEIKVKEGDAVDADQVLAVIG